MVGRDEADLNEVEVRVAALRKRLRLFEVAAGIGISPTRLSAFLHGRATPSDDVVERLARLLGVDAGALRTRH